MSATTRKHSIPTRHATTRLYTLTAELTSRKKHMQLLRTLHVAEEMAKNPHRMYMAQLKRAHNDEAKVAREITAAIAHRFHNEKQETL